MIGIPLIPETKKPPLEILAPKRLEEKNESLVKRQLELRLQRLVKNHNKRLILLPVLFSLFQEHKLSDDKLFSLTSHLFSIRCDTCCSVIGDIANQVFFYGGIALQEEVAKKMELRSMFYYLRDLLNELNLRKRCCRKKFLSFVVEPFDLVPLNRLKKIPLQEYTLILEEYMQCRSQRDPCQLEPTENKVPAKSKLQAWTVRSLFFVSLLCTFRSFTGAFGSHSKLALLQYLGNLHIEYSVEESQRNLDDSLVYLQRCFHLWKQLRNKENERLCFSGETVNKKGQRSVSLIVIDPALETAVVCRTGSDPVFNIWSKVLAPLAMKELEIKKLQFLDYVYQSEQQETDWVIAFFFVHLLGADEYQKDFSCLKKLVAWISGRPSRAKEEIKTAMLQHLKVIRDRFLQHKATLTAGKNSADSGPSPSSSVSHLHQVWKEQFLKVVHKMIEEVPLYEHTSYAVSALMSLYSNSD